MKIKSKKKEFFEIDITFNEYEIQTLIDVFEHNLYMQQRHPEDLMGNRGEIYSALKSILEKDTA